MTLFGLSSGLVPGLARAEVTRSEPQRSTIDTAKYVVQLGVMRNATSVGNASLPDVMRAAARARASLLPGALVIDDPADPLLKKAASMHLAVLILDGQISRLSQAESNGSVTVAAQVDFVVRRGSDQSLKGTFQGGAAGSDSPRVLASRARLDRFHNEVVSGAVESALRGADKGLAEAAK